MNQTAKAIDLISAGNVVTFPRLVPEMASGLLAAVLDNLSDGVYVVDPDRRIVLWNRAAEELSGYCRDEVFGRRCADGILRHCDAEGSDVCRNGCPLQATLRDGQRHDARLFLLHKDGHRVPVSVRSAPIRDGDGDIVGMVEVFSDASPRLAVLDEVRQLRRESMIDPLTRIGNRRLMEARIQDLLVRLEGAGAPFAVLFVDVDHFKAINDRFGHAVGDRVLQEVAQTLTSGLRTVDVAGRWGGEEFVVVAQNVDTKRLTQLAERLRVLVASARIPVSDEESLGVTVSVGATMVREGDQLHDVIARADGLMYASKSLGRNRVTID